MDRARAGSSDVYDNEIPGGQYTNLLFQSKQVGGWIEGSGLTAADCTRGAPTSPTPLRPQLGLSGQFGAIKRAYAAANRVLGDIVKVRRSRPNTSGAPLRAQCRCSAQFRPPPRAPTPS